MMQSVQGSSFPDGAGYPGAMGESGESGEPGKPGGPGEPWESDPSGLLGT